MKKSRRGERKRKREGLNGGLSLNGGFELGEVVWIEARPFLLTAMSVLSATKVCSGRTIAVHKKKNN